MYLASVSSALFNQGSTCEAWLSYSRNWRHERSKIVPCSLSSNRSLQKKKIENTLEYIEYKNRTQSPNKKSLNDASKKLVNKQCVTGM